MKKIASYVGIFVVGFIACGIALKVMGDPQNLLSGTMSPSKQAVLTALSTVPPDLRRPGEESPVTIAAAKLEPSIVAIHVTGHPQQQQSPFGDFFGMPTPEYTPKGAGSGVIISSDGYIMTNNHVVADAADVKVHVGPTDGGRDYSAKVVGTDKVTDIAVLKVDPGAVPLRPAVLGNSDNVQVGDWAIAVGNPLDIGETVTLGIISAKDRKGSDLDADGQALVGTRIQTDAAINPGNSGGALADINGRVVGINEAILSPTGSYIGIGLAIPINDARRIAEQLIRTGHVVRPYLGIQYGPLSRITDINARKAEGLPLETDDGVVVGRVYSSSPASAAGLKVGDLIVSVDGKKITNTDDLNNEIQTKSVGDTLVLDILRHGQKQTINVTLKERPDSFGEQTQPQDNAPQPFFQGPGQGPDGQDQGNGAPDQGGNPFQQLMP